MIAEVYPVRRMPRKFDHFDYSVPDDFKLLRGQYVIIPFRIGMCVGIVKRVKEKPLRGVKLKAVSSIIDGISLREQEIDFLESVARSITQSVSSLFFVALPQPSKKIEFSAFSQNITNTQRFNHLDNDNATIDRLAHTMTEKRSAWIQSPDLLHASCILNRFLLLRPDHKTIILCPNVRDARLVSNWLNAKLCVTGEENNTERFSAWQHFRSMKRGLLVCTRTGLFLPDAMTTTVVVLRSGHSNHVEHNRNPRIDTREIAFLFSEKFSTKLFFFDVFPRVDDLYRFKEENMLWYHSDQKVKFINPSKEKKFSENIALVSSTAQKVSEILETGGRVLVILNKKGYAWKLRCQDCNQTILCPICGRSVRVEQHVTVCKHCVSVSPIPSRCPSCKSTRIAHRGFASGRIVELFKKWYPNIIISLLDAEQKKFDKSASVVLTTRAYLENHFDPTSHNTFSCIVYLDADVSFFSSHFRSSECAALTFFEWLGVVRSFQSEFIVQTEENEFFTQLLDNPEKFLKDELAQRSSFRQPPFEKWIQINVRESDPKKCEWETQILKQKLEQISDVRVSGNLIVRVPFFCLNDVQDVFAGLDDKIIIDTNAFS